MVGPAGGSDSTRAARPADGDGSRPLLFVVEDDPGVRMLISEVLDSEGMEVQTAADGWHALGWIVRQQPALLVLDFSLPSLDGTDIAYGLRTAHEADIPILVITGADEAAEKAAQVGAFAYLRKPFPVEDLIEAVRRGLGRS